MALLRPSCCLPVDYVDFLTSVTPENQEEFMMQVGSTVGVAQC